MDGVSTLHQMGMQPTYAEPIASMGEPTEDIEVIGQKVATPLRSAFIIQVQPQNNNLKFCLRKLLLNGVFFSF
ncbi:MAG: hypothetical protein VKK42_31645 [Lyngbya sp.]|nr:hypothetical protein [Lyngbya sp.]